MEHIGTESEQPILNIVGEKVALGPLRHELLPLYLRWVNDFEVAQYIVAVGRPTTAEAEEAWYQTQSTDRSGVHFTIYERPALRPIGNVALHNIDHQHRIATFGIMIGERDSWNKGYGTEATRLILHYGFTSLGLHNIMLQVWSFNHRAMRAYQKAGFREIGRRREVRWVNGAFHDDVYMECLSTEFNASGLPSLGGVQEPIG